jgi:two-component system chemotaxis sensor kinase CheA
MDDIAALLVQSEATDVASLAKARDGLVTLLEGSDLPIPLKRLLARCGQAVESILEGSAADGTRALSEAGKHLEAAMDALDAPAPKPVAGPAPVAGAAPAESAPASPMVAAATVTQGQPSPALSPAATTTSAAPRPTEPVTAAPVQEEGLPPDTDPNLLGEYINECRDYIEGAEGALLTLEGNPEDTEAINVVFRAFHTIKGTSAFLGLPRIAEFSHRAESLLSRIRDREIRYTSGYADLALRSVDMLKALMQTVQNALGGVPLSRPAGYDELMNLLANPEDFAAAATINGDGGPPRLGDILVAQGVVDREDIEAIAASQGDQPLGIALVKSETASVADVAKGLRTQQRMSGGEAAVESWVRVRTDRLDRLIDMVGELVIAQSMVAQDATIHQTGLHEIQKKVSHTGKIVRELQDLSMIMRMIPLKATFQKMNRLVRDLAHKSGKSISFVTEGEDTEIDRNMVDVLNDPLVHMIRNSVDHGIEARDARERAGKPSEGVVTLMAYHAGGNVVIEVRDDGKGLDRQKIMSKAIAKGLLDSDKGLSDSEVFNLIFEPGFSTADQVTDVSGRGVGMDVVRRGIQSLNGHIDIDSQPGRGCSFKLRLPLTLAITDGMLVRVGAERYIIPTTSIYMTLRPEASQISTVAGRGEMVLLRGDLMPLFRLNRLFGVEHSLVDPTRGLLVIVSEGSRRYALMVDELLGQQQVVAKSVGSGIGKVLGISGAAILGDGRVGLILDPAEVATVARETV